MGLTFSLVASALVSAQGSQTDWCGTVTPGFVEPLDYSIPGVTGPSRPTIRIPVVFHIIYDQNGIGNHTDLTIQLQLDSLNIGFRDSDIEFYMLG
ncbi:MAG: hypothetical protein AAFU38_16565, partial [Bacteroidota bacterium]